jgi:hypothetical protein
MSNLIQFNEVDGVLCDAIVADEHGQVIFMSCYGYDASINRLFASFALSKFNGGLTSLSFDYEGRERKLLIGSSDRLTKTAGRLPNGLFGANLVHTFIYDESIVQDDMSNQVRWVVLRGQYDDYDVDQRLWSVIKRLSPIPLMDHWRVTILNALCKTGAIVTSMANENSLSLSIGLECWRVDLNSTHAQSLMGTDFSSYIANMVKNGVLKVELSGDKMAPAGVE